MSQEKLDEAKIRHAAAFKHLQDKVCTVLSKLDRGVWVAYVREAVRLKLKTEETSEREPEQIVDLLNSGVKSSARPWTACGGQQYTDDDDDDGDDDINVNTNLNVNRNVNANPDVNTNLNVNNANLDVNINVNTNLNVNANIDYYDDDDDQLMAAVLWHAS